MKKIFIGVFALSSLTVMAGQEIKIGSYIEDCGQKGCLQVLVVENQVNLNNDVAAKNVEVRLKKVLAVNCPNEGTIKSSTCIGVLDYGDSMACSALCELK